jgi:apolipoprotein D and lipocalin family protein
MKYISALFGGLFLTLGCAGPGYKPTSAPVDLPRYMGPWHVWTGRTTFVEKGAQNALEKYTWNDAAHRIDIDFTFRKGGPGGKLKRLPQKAWVVADSGNARWTISPFWPLRFDYLILAFDPNYAWTAVGVPSGSYLWIMGRDAAVSDARLAEIVEQVRATGYPVQDLVRVPQDP